MNSEIAASARPGDARADEDEKTVRVRLIGPADRAAAVAVARAAFHGSAFYERVTGLDAAGIDAYWDPFFALALADAHARVFGLERDGRVIGLLVAGLHGFPGAWRGLCFLVRLLGRVGLRPWLGYLAFVVAYERVMRRPAAERRIEARGLWLMVRPQRHCGGLGSRLVSEVCAAVSCEGRTLQTGFFDADDPRLRSFYEHLGFTTTPAFPFRGCRAALNVRRSRP